MTKKTNYLYYLSVFCIIQYIITTCFLFYFYEGSSRYNLNHNSYLFFENFLSDLGRTIGFNEVNNITSIFYAITLSIVGIGIASFFIYLSCMFKLNVALKIKFIGVLSGVFILLVGIFPVDTHRLIHIIFLGIGYLLFFIAMLICNVLMFKEKNRFKSVFFLITLLNIALLVYILILILGGDPQLSYTSLLIQVIAQKIIVYGQLLILGIVLFKLKDINKKKTA